MCETEGCHDDDLRLRRKGLVTQSRWLNRMDRLRKCIRLLVLLLRKSRTQNCRNTSMMSDISPLLGTSFFACLSCCPVASSSLFPCLLPYDPSPSYPSYSYFHPDSVSMMSNTNARNLHMADFVTMINGLCGIMSIFNSLAFCLSHPSDYSYLWKALGFPVAGLLADFFDGKVARWRGKSSLLGQELDSLADLVRIS